MSFGSTIRRFNPLRADLVALTEPTFDPLKQSWVAAALAAVLAAAFLWAGFALMFGWRSRYRAQGTLALVVLLLVGVHSIALAALAE